MVAGWAVIGGIHYAIESHWTMKGLLTLLDEKWKGTLLLAGVLFYRTIHEVLARMQRFHIPFADMAPIKTEEVVTPGKVES